MIGDQYRQRDDDYAIFTNDTYHITRQFDINVGARATTIDNKVLNSTNQNINGNTGRGCSAIDGSPLTQFGLIPQALINTVCLPFFSPAFNNFDNHQSEIDVQHLRHGQGGLPLEPRKLLTYLSLAKGFKAGRLQPRQGRLPETPSL